MKDRRRITYWIIICLAFAMMAFAFFLEIRRPFSEQMLKANWGWLLPLAILLGLGAGTALGFGLTSYAIQDQKQRVLFNRPPLWLPVTAMASLTFLLGLALWEWWETLHGKPVVSSFNNRLGSYLGYMTLGSFLISRGLYLHHHLPKHKNMAEQA